MKHRLRSFIFALSLILSMGTALVPVLANAAQTDTNTALNWAGYVSESGTYTSVNGTWVIPSISSVINGAQVADATWVGIGGVLTHDLIQAGTEAVPDDSGSVVYQAWYETLPGASRVVPLAVHAGDSVTVSVAQQSTQTGVWLITFTNNTTGGTYQVTLNYTSSFSSAEWIEELPVGLSETLSLDNFGIVNFTDGSTLQNGINVSIANSGAHPLTMTNAQHESVAVPSALNTDGASFSVARTDAASTSLLLNRYATVRMFSNIPTKTVRSRSRFARGTITSAGTGAFRIVIFRF